MTPADPGTVRVPVEPLLGDRGRIYQALKDAAPDGVTASDLGGGGGVGAHIESLRYEGHGIEHSWEKLDVGWRPRYTLTKDAWA